MSGFEQPCVRFQTIAKLRYYNCYIQGIENHIENSIYIEIPEFNRMPFGGFSSVQALCRHKCLFPPREEIQRQIYNKRLYIDVQIPGLDFGRCENVGPRGKLKAARVNRIRVLFPQSVYSAV